MEVQKIQEFKKKMDELQLLAQKILREIPDEIDDIRWAYYDNGDQDAKEVSLCGVRIALARSVRKAQLQTAVHNIERCIQINEQYIH